MIGDNNDKEIIATITEKSLNINVCFIIPYLFVKLLYHFIINSSFYMDFHRVLSDYKNFWRGTM